MLSPKWPGYFMVLLWRTSSNVRCWCIPDGRSYLREFHRPFRVTEPGSASSACGISTLNSGYPFYSESIPLFLDGFSPPFFSRGCAFCDRKRSRCLFCRCLGRCLFYCCLGCDSFSHDITAGGSEIQSDGRRGVRAAHANRHGDTLQLGQFSCTTPVERGDNRGREAIADVAGIEGKVAFTSDSEQRRSHFETIAVAAAFLDVERGFQLRKIGSFAELGFMNTRLALGAQV